MFKNVQISPSEAKIELSKMELTLEKFLKSMGVEIDNVTRVMDDPNEIFLRDQIHSISDRLNGILNDIVYLDRKIVAEGNLYLNEQGRYEIEPDIYLTSGNVCELLIRDDFDEVYVWTKTSIEHGENGYYAVALGRDISINGIRARVRR